MEGESVQYFDDLVQDWLRATVLRIQDNGRYDVEVRVPQSTATKTVHLVEPRKLKRVREQAYRQYLRLQYKRSSNFNPCTPFNLLL